MEAGRQLNDALSWAAVFVREVRFFSAENILFLAPTGACLFLSLPILRNRGIWSSGLSLRAVRHPLVWGAGSR